MTDETTLTEEQVRKETLEQVNVPAHWAYVFGVMGGGLALMLLLMAVLGGSG